MREVQWSEVQRDPKGVAELVDQKDVRVRRRDGAPLLLTREDRTASSSEGAVTAARALRNVLHHLSPDALIDLLTDEFPWISLLPEGSRSSFAVDFVQNFRISADLGQWAALDQTVHEWKATAAVCADPALAGQLTGPVEGDLGPVPPPSEFDA